MRELKFRTPCKCQNGHFNYCFFEIKNGEIMHQHWDEARMCSCRKFDIGEGYDPCGADEQFTELFDKNGAEIFEGDICTAYRRNQEESEGFVIKDRVYFSVGGFTLFNKPLQDFTWYNGDLDFQKSRQKILKYVMWMTPARLAIPAYYYIIEDIEVIGNIYENPELLT